MLLPDGNDEQSMQSLEFDDQLSSEIRTHDEGKDYIPPYIPRGEEYAPNAKLVVTKRPPYKLLSIIIAIAFVLYLVVLGSWSLYHDFPTVPAHTVQHGASTNQQVTPPAVLNSLVGVTKHVPQNAAVTTTDGVVCWVSFGGTVKVVTDKGDNVVVSYTPPSEPSVPSSYSCPIGTLYTLSRTAIQNADNEYLAQEETYKRDMQIVAAILSQNYYGSSQPVYGYNWVEVMNLTPVNRSFDHTSAQFSNSCTVGTTPGGAQGGTIQERGKAPDGRILYEYTPDGQTYGSECPKGTLFFKSTSSN